LARRGDTLLSVSPLVRLEAIVKPLRDSNTKLVADDEDVLAAQRWLAGDDRIFDRASQLRAGRRLKTPDAFHLATALHDGCDKFWTNDDRLRLAAGGMAVDVLGGCAEAMAAIKFSHSGSHAPAWEHVRALRVRSAE